MTERNGAPEGCGYIMQRKMKRQFQIIGMFISLTLVPAFLPAADLVHHDLTVTLSPGEHRITARDTVTLPKGPKAEIVFSLHAGLGPKSATPGVQIKRGSTGHGPVPTESYTVTLPAGTNSFTLEYGGVIHHPLEQYGREQARGQQDSPGIISEEGVYLSGSSGWYPAVGEGLVSFSLNVTVPQEWDAVSQGERTSQEPGDGVAVTRWSSPEPQDEIFLIAGPFTEFVKPAGDALAMAFLRGPDSALAAKYLDATVGYLAMYGKLIGPYPYKKFALVENFWETGFGMPSFTLLGPTIIRLPFIINTSYPHEILHNWWGNSVFPDYEKGNWSEGLTAYLADHLIKEQQGGGAEYRVTTLQKYADYVLAGRDFPLTRFTSRHSTATEAVGYGKSLMFFHMLRLKLDDKAFIAGLQDFYRAKKFRFATFDDLRKSFEKVSGKSLAAEFDQWVKRTGAPELRLTDAKTRGRGDGFVLSATVGQVQPGKAYRLRIPLAVTMEGREKAYQTVVEMKKKKLEFKLALPARPLRLDIDPEYDLFRRLGRDEIPPAITQALGAKKMLVVLPGSAGKELREAYQELAGVLARSGPDDVEVKLDSEVKKLSSNTAVTILGWENRFMEKALSTLTGYDVAVTKKSVKIGKTKIVKDNHSFVLTAENPENRDMALMVIASDRAASLPGLGRKLPHYHKYSYLAFEGEEPANVAKGRWPVRNSPMTAFLPDGNGRVSQVEMARLAFRAPLAALPPVFSKERMMETVTFLAGDEMKGRGLGTPELDRVAEYIAQRFQEAGLKPGSDSGSWFQEWEGSFLPQKNATGEAEDRPLSGKVMLKNVIGVIPGKKPGLAQESVVIGAHYDHLGMGTFGALKENKGKVHPGADDNASGVAVLIELAKDLKETLDPGRSIVFVAFTGEEEGKKGSKHYIASEKHYPASKTIGMVNLDTVGRLGKNKLLVLGAGSAKEWVHIFRGAGFVTGVEIETVSEELDSSDQKSFQDAGVPAVQLFSGPHLDYHRPTDTIDKIDADGLVKVASVAKEVVEYLASREGPLTVEGKPGEKSEAGSKKERKISLGTVPDFAFKGEGVRLSGVVPGSPAEAAGLKEGDVIVRINEAPVKNLKDLSDALKTMKAGDKAAVVFLRNGKESQVVVEVKER
jgi:hypothetical protein